MATGYTHDVAEGKVTDFKEFAMSCARAMGVAIMMRDDPFGPVDIEKCIDRSSEKYAEESLNKALEKQKRSDKDILGEYDAYREKELSRHEEAQEEDGEKKVRYESMLAKVETWKSPTPEHDKFKEFMVNQLTESIGHDCGSDYHEKEVEKVEAITSEEFLSNAREGDEYDVDYYTKRLQEAKDRNEERRVWITALLDSLQEEVAV